MFNEHNADFLFAYEIVLSSHLLCSESQYFDVGSLIFILNQGIKKGIIFAITMQIVFHQNSHTLQWP